MAESAMSVRDRSMASGTCQVSACNPIPARVAQKTGRVRVILSPVLMPWPFKKMGPTLAIKMADAIR